MSSSVSTSFFPLAFVSVTSNTVPVTNSPVISSVKRIFKSFSTDTKLTLTFPDATGSEDSSSVVVVSSVLRSCTKAPDNAAFDMAINPFSPTMPIFLSSLPSGASAVICLLSALDCINMLKITIAATTRTTPVAARIASKAVR